MRYPSKRDLWLNIIVWLLIGWILYLMIIDVGQGGHLFQSVLIPSLVVIFLVDRDAFLKEMKRRCPNARIES